MTDPDARPARRPRRLRLTLGALTAIIAAIVAGSWVGGRPAPPKLPDPNGYDDLVRAGSLIQGEWTGSPDPAVLRPFVEANRAALDLARVGLGRECLVHFEDSEAGLTRHSEGSGRLKEVARLLTFEGVVAQSEGRIGDASRSFRDAMDVGQALTQGGMLAGAQLGWFLQKINSGHLRKLRDRLSKADARATLADLEALDLRRVPVDSVVARWERWYRGAFDPFQRTLLRWNGIEATERANQRAQAGKARDQAGRALRFLMIELAIHAYHEDKKAWPRSLGDLVPAYLASVPLDPVTGLPIDYPANSSGELTDDLSAIARPDGEVSTPPSSPPAGDPVGNRPD